MSKWSLAAIACAAVLTLPLQTVPVFAQHAGGIAQCLAACAKSDKGCQDHCAAIIKDWRA